MTEREIFLAVIDLPDRVARATCPDRACGTGAALRARVEELLRSHKAAGSFLGTPIVAPPDPDSAHAHAFAPTRNPDAGPAGGTDARRAAETDDEPLTFLAPKGRPDPLGRIGHDEVLRVLGKGGFGSAFRALDEHLHRVVAVKVLWGSTVSRPPISS